VVEAQLFTDGDHGIADFVDSALQFVFRDLEMPGPLTHASRIRHDDVAAVFRIRWSPNADHRTVPV
jgi:hypothetical protein